MRTYLLSNQPCSWVVLLLWFSALHCGAQSNLHPQHLDARIRLEALQLPPAGHPVWSEHIDRDGLNQRLDQERVRFGDSVTIDEIHQIADALTLFLRNQGYAFHTVYLAPQKVQAGIVTLSIQQGTLSDIHLINESGLPDSLFRKPFRSLLNKTLYAPDVEQRVQALKMQTGFKVYPFYSRGVEPGEARLNLRITQGHKRQFALRADNYGSKTTGRDRLIASYTEHQLTHHHDRLSLAVLHSLSDVDNTYGSIQYVRPTASLRYAWDVSLSNNQFDVGDRFASLGLQGDTRVWDVGVTRYSDFHPRSQSDWRFSLSEKDSEIASTAGVAQAEISRSASLVWQKRLQADSARWVWQSLLEFSGGVFGTAKGDLHEHFNKIATTQFWLLANGQNRTRQIWQFSLRGQYADSVTPSTEGLTLTGAYGVRAYAPGAFNADRGALLSLEWRWPNLLSGQNTGLRIEPFVHADLAYGDDGEGENFSWAEFGSSGVGLRLQLGKRMRAQATYATSFTGSVNSVEVGDDEQLLFEIRWQ